MSRQSRSRLQPRCKTRRCLQAGTNQAACRRPCPSGSTTPPAPPLLPTPHSPCRPSACTHLWLRRSHTRTTWSSLNVMTWWKKAEGNGTQGQKVAKGGHYTRTTWSSLRRSPGKGATAEGKTRRLQQHKTFAAAQLITMPLPSLLAETVRAEQTTSRLVTWPAILESASHLALLVGHHQLAHARRVPRQLPNLHTS